MRVVNKNFLFVASVTKTQEVGSENTLMCYEVDGEAIDEVIKVDLKNADNLTACGLQVGSDALYVTMGTRYAYSLPIMKTLLENEITDLHCDELNLVEHSSTVFQFQDTKGKEVFQVRELEMENKEILVCIVFKDCKI